MAYRERQKISQMTPKGADIESTDLIEVSTIESGSYVTRSITGQEITDGIIDVGGLMTKAEYDPQDVGIVNTAHKEMVSAINKTGVTITKGSIVYLKTSSSSGTHPEILLADADTEATSSKTLGAVYENILNDAVGYVVTSGEVDNLNTSAYNIGDRLWLSQTAGQVTTTPPVQPAHTVFIGTVTRSQNTNGRILYAIQNGYELNELHDVLITSIANNQVLTYESSSLLWKNKSIATALGYTPASTLIDFKKESASYTLLLADANKMIEMEVSTANTLTIPTNTAQAFPVGTQILISQLGTGQTTITPDVGVTLRSSGGKTKTAAQYAICTLIKRTTNEWYLAGDLTT
jgi:hypothetical protein